MKVRHSKPRAVVAEDEAELRAELVGHLRRLWPELQIEGEASDGIEAISMIERLRPDVVFLDIQMPGLTGIDVARQIDGRCHVVFVTAYNEHALSAFEHGAVDYVLKPYNLPRLARAVDRLRLRTQGDVPLSLTQFLDEFARHGATKKFLRWIKASVGDEIRLILVDDVCFFQADAKYTTVALASGDAVIRTPLKQLHSELDPEVFVSIHRSAIVNIRAIRRVIRGHDGRMEVLLNNRPERLPVSETNRHYFKSM